MKAKYYYHFILLFIFTMLALGVSTSAEARPSELQEQYNESKPLVYEDAWDLPPYSFLNEKGVPEGFNIDLVRMICRRLNIPLTIRLKPTDKAFEALKKGESDLALGMYANYRSPYAKFGKTAVTLFTHSMLAPKDKPIQVYAIDDVRYHKVIVHRGSFSHHQLENMGLGSQAIPLDEMKEAAMQVEMSDSGQILWNTMSLKWYKNKYHLDGLQLTPVDMIHGEYRFMSNDTRLLAAFDSMYNILRANDELQPLNNKWFYPEAAKADYTEYFNYGSILFIIAVLLLIINNQIFRYFVTKINNSNQAKNMQLELILQSGKVRIWTYHIANRTFTTYRTNGTEARTYTSSDFLQQFSQKDADKIRRAIFNIRDNVHTQERFFASRKIAKDRGAMHLFEMRLSVLQREKNVPSVIICTARDVNDEQKKQLESRNMLMRYVSIFNSSSISMVYFDANGVIVDLNDKSCEIFGITDKKKYLSTPRRLIYSPPHKKMDLNEQESHYFSLKQDMDDLEHKSEYMTRTGILYYENLIAPIRDENGNISGIFSVGRDLTEMVEEVHKQKEEMKKVEKITRRIQQHIEQINYALSESNIRIVNYDPHTRTIEITRNLGQEPVMISQIKALAMTAADSHQEAYKTLTRMDQQEPFNFNITIQTLFHTKDGKPVYLEFVGIPMYDSEGKLERYHGLCRDVSELVAAEIMLKRETQKAQETELLKNSFLRNMSYEIRTPINAVVGFAELFETEHDPEDEAIFVEQIKINSNRMLMLINDILFLSRLDANMIEIKKAPIDFGPVFESNCQTGWSAHLQSGVKTIIENPYEHLVVNTDTQYVSTVLQYLAANAARSTRTGIIKAKYEYYRDTLTIVIEDTGDGIAPEQLPHIFERFARNEKAERFGTGLEMPICKEIAERLGGRIEVESELHKGTTVWLTLPCEATHIKRKMDLPN